MRSSIEIDKPLFVHPEKTNERYLYMSSPFRNAPISDRTSQPKPVLNFFAGAFPEDFEPTSSELSPSISSTHSTPIRNPESILHSSPVNKEERALEKRIREQQNNIEWLSNVEMKTYEYVGEYPDFSFDPTHTPISEKSIESKLSPYNNSPFIPSPDIGFSQLRITSPVKAIHPISTDSNRPPPILCIKPQSTNENTDYQEYLANSPPHWEANGVQQIIRDLQNWPQCKVHICNLSAVNAVYTVRKAKRENNFTSLTCETAGIYLHFSDIDISNGDTRFKVSPPIRTAKNKELLSEVLKVNGIDTITSYHRPVKPVLKFLEQGDFARAVNGICSMGFTLHSTWEIMKEDDPKVQIPKIIKLLAENPAKIAGIYENKGSLAVGKHADILIWDPFSIDDCNFYSMHSKHPQINPFLGEKMHGKVIRTYLRGEIVYDDGEVIKAKGLLLNSS